MALWRQVRQNMASKKWAFIETSDENSIHCIIMGGKEFDTEEEAEEWRKGFSPFTYEWKDPKIREIEKWEKEKERAEALFKTATDELEKLKAS